MGICKNEAIRYQEGGKNKGDPHPFHFLLEI